MIIWINGAFGSGKTTTAFELHRHLPDSFVYDPENVGYFIRKNAPDCLSGGDFQDIPLWRDMNYEMLRLIHERHSGDIIVPMTLVNPDYLEQIVGRLRCEHIEVRHFILYAGREELIRRLKVRSWNNIGRESFAVSSIARCLHSFDNLITEGRIDTEGMSVDEVVEKIAEGCGIVLTPEKRSRVRKLCDRFGIHIRHIR
ncbi:MAG: AAA family ATPase [Eubacteriales bacterium]